MRRLFFLLSYLVVITCSGNSQNDSNQVKLTGIIREDLKIILRPGNVMADIMDSIVQTPKQTELTVRFQEAMIKNYSWFLEFAKTVPEGESLPYNEKFGMTKDEYFELLHFLENVEIVSSGKEEILIEQKNGFIYFKSKNRLSNLDFLSIDLKDNLVLFGPYKMMFSDSFDVKSADNGLKSKWKGYKWHFKEPKDVVLDSPEDLGKLTMKDYEFTIGLIESDGKTYFKLKGREVEDGKGTVQFELPVKF